MKSNIIARMREYHDKNAICLDTETTGLVSKYPQAEAVELALVDTKGIVEYQTLIKPYYRIPDEVSKIHGITNEMVEHAPRYQDVEPILEHIIGGRTILTYNAVFDRDILQNTAAICGATFNYQWKWDCIMETWKLWIGASRWVKLEEACRGVGYTLTGAHRAMADTKAARAILAYLAAQSEPAIQQELITGANEKPSAVEMGF